MWKGELRGRVGLFPYNFVQELNDEEVEQQVLWLFLLHGVYFLLRSCLFQGTY